MGVPTPATILKFILAAAVGVGTTLGIAAVSQSGPRSSAVAGPASLYDVAAASGGPLAFTVQQLAVPSGAPGGTVTPLLAPPADKGIQLISFTSNPAPPATSTARPAWINPSGYPRVPPISQFDGGPLQGFNCTMASGAMLARLGFGIVTTGSLLRGLQPQQGQSGTNLGDLDTAVGNGWGVHFAQGALTPLQFRALIYAGAGAVLQGVYGQLPVAERLQADFTGPHAIYIDAFRPPQAGQDAAYYVIDPIGHTWAGYKGQWLPASDIETFATALGGGTMITAWAFPGGLTPPAHYRSLPPEAFPSAAPSASPSEAPSGSTGASSSPEASSPGASPSATATETPTSPPLPTPAPSGVPSPPSGTITPLIPPDILRLLQLSASVSNSILAPNLGLCVTPPTPVFCPAGLPATYLLGAGPGPAPSPTFSVQLLYASVPQPGLVQVIFSGPGSGSALSFWPTDGGTAQAADVVQATLGGQTVWMATFPVSPGSYGFGAGTLGAGVAGLSRVGALTIGP